MICKAAPLRYQICTCFEFLLLRVLELERVVVFIYLVSCLVPYLFYSYWFLQFAIYLYSLLTYLSVYLLNYIVNSISLVLTFFIYFVFIIHICIQSRVLARMKQLLSNGSAPLVSTLLEELAAYATSIAWYIVRLSSVTSTSSPIVNLSADF